MKFLLVLATILFLSSVELLEVKPDFYAQNNEQCKKMTKDPYFDIDMVIGKPWRIYYTWNGNLDDKCLDMKFKNATPWIIHRIWSDMNEYTEQQPHWDAATLHVTMGSALHEMLLFADQGAAGSFLGVPNVIRDANMSPMKRTVPLLKFFLKLVRDGKFLLMMDCHIGMSSLSAHPEQPPYRMELAAAAAELDLGDGTPACTRDKNVNEMLLN